MKTHLQIKTLAATMTAMILVACGDNTGGATQPQTQSSSNPVTTQATTAPVATALQATKPIAATTVAPATAAQVTAALPIGDPLDAIRKAQVASVRNAYRSEMVIESSNGKTMFKGEFVPPDNLHITIETDGKPTEMFIVDGKMWSKRDGKLSEPSGDKLTISTIIEQYAKDPESMGVKISDAKFVGADIVNGKATWVYSFVSTMESPKVKSTAKMWIGVANGLPLKQEIDGEALGVKSKTIQNISYDPTLKIVAPVK